MTSASLRVLLGVAALSAAVGAAPPNADPAAPGGTDPVPTTRLVADGDLSLRFYGHGTDDIDRVKVRIDDPTRPVDVGRGDFTIEFWMRARAVDNPAPAVSCGRNVNWIHGNVVLDRDRYNRDRKFGLALADGRLVWGVSGNGTGDRTVCGRTLVADGGWHHVAVDRRRSDGRLRLWVDGRLDAAADGPGGNVSYPDGSTGGDFCGGPCPNDPFLVFGAEKHDAGAAYPSYSGWLDELRVSTVLRYRDTFSPRARPFRTDPSTVGLYHFDDGGGRRVTDSSRTEGGPSHGTRKVGGSAPRGPVYQETDPF